MLLLLFLGLVAFFCVFALAVAFVEVGEVC